jgi:transposase
MAREFVKAADHDMGCEVKHVPFGIVDEDTGDMLIVFGSSFKTSDFIVDGLQTWWQGLSMDERESIAHLQLKMDNGPESSGARTQFLKRIVDFADEIKRSIQLLYYPPYHSKYNPIERCWGILEQHWNGALLDTSTTMLQWAKSMTWKGINPIVSLSQKVYQKGVSLSAKTMQTIETRLQRNPLLPKWDILIHHA